MFYLRTRHWPNPRSCSSMMLVIQDREQGSFVSRTALPSDLRKPISKTVTWLSRLPNWENRSARISRILQNRFPLSKACKPKTLEMRRFAILSFFANLHIFIKSSKSQEKPKSIKLSFSRFSCTSLSFYRGLNCFFPLNNHFFVKTKRGVKLGHFWTRKTKGNRHLVYHRFVYHQK